MIGSEAQVPSITGITLFVSRPAGLGWVGSPQKCAQGNGGGLSQTPVALLTSLALVHVGSEMFDKLLGIALEDVVDGKGKRRSHVVAPLSGVGGSPQKFAQGNGGGLSLTPVALFLHPLFFFMWAERCLMSSSVSS
jgi:hypothetical protein